MKTKKRRIGVSPFILDPPTAGLPSPGNADKYQKGIRGKTNETKRNGAVINEKPGFLE